MPPKPLAEVRKTEQLRMLLTVAERTELDYAAAAAGKPLSTWARDLLLAAARAAATPPATPAKKRSTKAAKSKDS